jgi:hypothetical protein
MQSLRSRFAAGFAIWAPVAARCRDPLLELGPSSRHATLELVTQRYVEQRSSAWIQMLALLQQGASLGVALLGQERAATSEKLGGARAIRLVRFRGVCA